MYARGEYLFDLAKFAGITRKLIRQLQPCGHSRRDSAHRFELLPMFFDQATAGRCFSVSGSRKRRTTGFLTDISYWPDSRSGILFFRYLFPDFAVHTPEKQ